GETKTEGIEKEQEEKEIPKKEKGKEMVKQEEKEKEKSKEEEVLSEEEKEVKEQLEGLEFPLYIPDKTNFYSPDKVESIYGAPIRIVEDFVENIKKTENEKLKNQIKDFSDIEILSELKDRIKSVGKYEKLKDKQDELYDAYSNFLKNYPDINSGDFLIGIDYLIWQEKIKKQREKEERFESQLPERERRKISTSIENKGGILETSKLESVFSSKETREDLKRGEIAYKLLKEYCLDEETEKKIDELKSKKDKLLEENPELLKKRYELEGKIRKSKNENEKKELEEELSLLNENEKLRELDEISQEILKLEYSFNDDLEKVLRNFYAPDKIKDEKQERIFQKILEAKKISFDEIVKEALLDKENKKEEEKNKDLKRIYERLKAIGIEKISMPEIEKYALEFVELLDRRKGFIDLPEKPEFYKYIFVKTPEAAKDILLKNIDYEKARGLKKEILEEKKKEEAEKKEKVGEKEEAKKETPKKLEQSPIKETQKKEKEEISTKRGILKTSGGFGFFGILGEILGEFLKKFWETLKKNKDKFKKFLKS
ncbi:MAG: hypothetical protein ACP5H7_02480, partial [Minisyncoccia bacterium]